VHAIVVKSSGEIVVSGRVHALPPEPPANGPVDWRVASYRVTAAKP
jgi:hypothetical protein